MKCVLIVCIALMICFALCSCLNRGSESQYMIFDNDREYDNRQLNMFLEAIENQDKDVIISLFSQNVVSNVEDFESSVYELFEYVKGEVESYNDGAGPSVEATSEDGHVFKIAISNYEIKTSEDNYRLAIQYIPQDTSDPKNEGIHSVYIIRTEDDTDFPQYAYRGDDKYTPGIHIGIKNHVDIVSD